jgi:hypothetical protein
MKRESPNINSDARRMRGVVPRGEPKLEIVHGTLSDDALRQFVNDCIVPALVNEFLRWRMNLPEPPDGSTM